MLTQPCEQGQVYQNNKVFDWCENVDEPCKGDTFS